MRRFISPSKFATLALSLSLSQQVFGSPWPALDNDKQKLEFGLALRAEIRPFFQGTFNYGMEWWRIADTQNELKSTLRPLYPHELEVRPLVTLTLNQSVERTVPEGQVLASWKQTLIARLSTGQNGQNHVSKKSLIKELFDKSLFVKTIRPRELTNSLLDISPLDEPQRKALKQSTTEEKLAYLKVHLPEDIKDTPIFSGQKLPHLKQLVGTREKALKALEEAAVYEADLPALTALVVATSELPIEANLPALVNAIDRIDESQFALMHSQDHEDLFKGLFASLDTLSADRATVTDVSKSDSSTLKRTLDKVLSLGSKSANVQAPRLILVEKNREISLMKSSWGQDCSHTRCSFAKLDDPAVHVFFIVDPEKNREVGYIVTELKDSPIGKVLYLTSMNGPSLTSEQTEEVFFALHSGRQQFGATRIVIAERSIEDHINYQPITEVFEKYVVDHPTIPVHPLRPQIATIIDHYVDMEYMKEANHTAAAVYNPPVGWEEHLVSSSLHDNTRVMSRAIDPKEALLFSLELDAAKRWLPQAGQLSEGERAIVAANLDLENYRKLREVFHNPNHLPYEQFLETVKTAMAGHGVEVDKTFISERPYLFYTGQLVAPDATSGPLRKSTIRLVVQLLKRDVYHPLEGLAEFTKNPANVEAIDSSRDLDGVFKWVLGGFDYHSFEMRNMAELGIGHPRIREPDFTRMLLRYVVHGGGWSGEQSEYILLAAYPNIQELNNAFKTDGDPDVREGLKRLLEKHSNGGPVKAARRGKPQGQSHSKVARTCEELFH